MHVSDVASTHSIHSHQINELYDPDEELTSKVNLLADKIKKSTNLVVITGAGISTSANIPDFRGPKGVWTLRQFDKLCEIEEVIEHAAPTLSHMALYKLQEEKKLHFVISQNVDGLHLKSGIKPELLVELHGNVFLEICDDCGAHFFRDYAVGEKYGSDVDFSGLSKTEAKHVTGRKCEQDGCGGILRDSIIEFGEPLPKYEYEKAKKALQSSDLVLVLGSSLQVAPACELPKLAKDLVIVNLQKTQLDSQCSLRIFHKTDHVMRLLLSLLELDVPKYDGNKYTCIYIPENGKESSRKPAPRLDPEIHRIADQIDLSVFDNTVSSPSCNIL